jgi:hypothetical protein
VLLAHGLVAAESGAQPSSARGLTRVVVLSDFNESYGSVRYSHHVDDAVTRAIDLKPDLVISTGDRAREVPNPARGRSGLPAADQQ